MNYKLGSLFDGSGGFPLAGSLCSIEPVWASEVEPYPIAVTKSRFPKMKHLGDISKINGAEIEPVDIITFGSPCQDLSVAGKRAGLKHEANGDEETTRSGLFMEAVRIIKEMREKTNGILPRFAVWENVPGAFSSNKGEDFKVVLEELIKVVEPNAVMPEVPPKGWPYADCYIGDGWSIAYRVLDAQYWGVPQRRRRIYLVADFRGECAKDILFEREGLRGYFTQGRTPWKATPTDAERGIGTDDREGEIPYTLKIRSGVSVDSYGKGAGKGALIQKNLSATLGVSQDQYLFQPIGADIYNLATTGDKGHLVIEPFCKSARGKFKGDAETWKDAKVANTLNTFDQGEVRANELVVQNFIDVEMEVAVRKYEVNAEKLVKVLRDHKGSMTNKFIAEALGCPITQVEHWFRTDQYFAIPEPEVWFKLKDLLGISTTEFDESIMTFEYKGGNYDMRNRIHIGDTAPTLTCGSGNTLHLLPGDAVICLQGNGIDRADTAGCNGKGWREDASYTLNTIDRPAVVYAVDQGGGKSSANVTEDKAPTLCTTHGGEPAVAYSFDSLASNSMKSKNPHSGCRKVEVAKTLDTSDPNPSKNQGGIAVVGSLCAADYKGVGNQYVSDGKLIVERAPHYIVRRLTPTECARLQGFADRHGDIDKKKDFTDEEYNFWLEVRKTYDAINGRAEKNYTKPQILTWYNKLHTDSAEYKMWGNGIALPTALYVMQGIEDALSWAEFME